MPPLSSETEMAWMSASLFSTNDVRRYEHVVDVSHGLEFAHLRIRTNVAHQLGSKHWQERNNIFRRLARRWYL